MMKTLAILVVPAVVRAVCDVTCATCSGSLATDCLTCAANAQLSGASPNSCECISTYGPSPTAANCVLCHSTCQACSGTTDLDCTSCFTNAQISTANPHACECAPGYFTTSTVASCVACDSSCKRCTSTSDYDCTECYQGADLGGATVGSCSCLPNFVERPDVAHCQTVCHPSCNSCDDSGASSCTSCFSNAHLTGASPSSCDCDIMTWPTPTSRVCTGCHPSCSTCSGVLSTDCSTCYPNAHIDSGECKCDSPLVPWPDASSCVPCDPTCLTCTMAGSSGCTSCKAKATLNGVPPSSCSCDPGFFISFPSYNCVPCSSVCRTCIGMTASQCATCYSYATLASAAPSECTCDVGYYPHPSPSNCLPCHPQCAACIDELPGSCTACRLHATLTPPSAPNGCSCDGGYFPDPDPSLCSICDATCQTCSDGGPEYCTSCQPNAELRNTAPGKCHCKAGFVPSPTTANCAPLSFCHPTCKTCTTPYATGCLTCYNNAVLQGNGPNPCSCRLGYYGSPDADNCKPCHQTCGSCANELEDGCTGCYFRAHLNGGAPSSCVCNSGTYPSPNASQCAPCPTHCNACSETVCTECSAGYYLQASGSCAQCFETCSICNSYPSCLSCVAGLMLTSAKDCVLCENCGEPLRPNVTSPYDHIFKIEFNRKAIKRLTTFDVVLETDPPTPVNWTVFDEYELLVRVSGGPWTNDTQFLLVFFNSSSIIDIFGNTLSISEVELSPPLHSTLQPLTDSNSTNSTITSPRTSVLVTSGMVTTCVIYAVLAVFLAVAAGNVSLSVPLLSHFAYFSYFSQCGLFPDVINWFSAIGLKSLFPNFFSNRSYIRGRKLDSDALLESGSGYLLSIGGVASVTLLIAGMHGTLRLMALHKRKLQYVETILQYVEWGLYIHFANITFIDLAVSSIYEISHGTFSITALSDWLASMTAGAVFFGLIVYSLFIAYALFKHKFTARKSLLAVLMRNFRRDKPSALYFYPLTYSQRVLYSLVIVGLRYYRAVQGVFIVLLSLGMVMYTSLCQPFALPVLQFLHICSEVLNLFACLLLFITALLSDSESASWAVFAVVMASSLCLFLLPVAALIYRHSAHIRVLPMRLHAPPPSTPQQEPTVKSMRAYQFEQRVDDSRVEVSITADNRKRSMASGISSKIG